MQNSKKFTLIELMVALGVFSIMMAIMMDFFGQAQRAWRTSESLTRVFENARTIFDTIEGDLIHAVASNDNGREIPFAIVRKEGDNGPFPYMVSKVADTSKSRSKLAEVTYKIDSAEINGKVIKDVEDNPVDFFKRSVTPDYTGKSANSRWDFYGAPKGSSMNWTERPSAAHGVAPGVLNIQFHYRTLKATAKDYEESSARARVKVDHKVLPAAQTYHFLPRIVDVEVTLFDPKSESRDNPSKTKRTFFKRFFVGQGPRSY